VAGRPKKAKITLASLAECTTAIRDLGLTQMQLESLIADRDTAVAKASAQYEAPIDRARAAVSDLELALRNYYYGHLTEVEVDGRKSIQLATGVMGRRDNPPKLTTLGRATLASVKVAVKALWGMKYFHPAKEPDLDREALKALDAEALKKVGLKVEQDETWYVEPARLPGAEAQS
jgi:phage host-nuclease inhibitor protein Gam